MVEDDLQLGPLMAEILADEYTVTLAQDGPAGLEAGRRGDFAVVLLDRRLPGMDGVEVVRQLRDAGVRTPVLMLTALGAVPDRVDGLDAGADDYLTKPFDFAELAARIRALRRVHGQGEEKLFIGDWEFRPSSRLINSPYEGRKVLTETEANLLVLLARHPDETLSRERILREVFPAGERVGTVDTYVHYVRRKTEHDIITTVRGHGYRLGVL
ncbi:DNA-binding response OmpR family regulator [Amnibacterium kyonggiense]|uniref:DNA-binding response OmpR family regulator n=1 Tax=Amnibacterium kyonggiense TaxID=595671 RepID=A0A4R7FPP1_9MICO|nr:DNA-binding response OmpR family regulator [Amnibacterium kyonggiense]